MNLDSAIFYSKDIEKVIPLYRDILKFKIDSHQVDSFVSFIFPNGARLGIKQSREEREIPGQQTVFISIINIEDWYDELKQKDITMYKPLKEVPWGKEFSILDKDGNKILFIER